MIDFPFGLFLIIFIFFSIFFKESFHNLPPNVKKFSCRWQQTLARFDRRTLFKLTPPPRGDRQSPAALS